MTVTGNGRLRRYRLDYPKVLGETVKDLYAQAKAAGQSQPFLSSLRQLLDRLENDPHNVGESLYKLPAMKLLVCHGLYGKLVLDFAVDDYRRIVYLRNIRNIDDL